ncbi:MAG: hypothetical protein OEY85_13620 [Rhodospirillales bacterium]|nr:hypothetical protein [Rhodospirillales bacterium]
MLSESTASIQTVNVALEISRVVTKFVSEQLKEAERKREAEDSAVKEQLAAKEAAQREAASNRDAEDDVSERIVALAESSGTNSGGASNGSLVNIQV